MSDAQTRALALLAANPGAAIFRSGESFALYTSADRRRRPRLRLSQADVRALSADGAITPSGPYAYVLAPAGASRAARAGARPEEAFLAQHAPIASRPLPDEEGRSLHARGFELAPAIGRLAVLRDAEGRAWFAPGELSAAYRLRLDWEAGQRGLTRGSDWSAPPRSRAARGPGGGAERAMAAGLDARRRTETALATLAPPLRRVVERVCLYEDGLEALERAERWPARSAKVALKLALAQLAAAPAA